MYSQAKVQQQSLASRENNFNMVPEGWKLWSELSSDVVGESFNFKKLIRLDCVDLDILFTEVETKIIQDPAYVDDDVNEEKLDHFVTSVQDLMAIS